MQKEREEQQQEQDKDEATDEQQEHALRSTCVQVADVDVDVTNPDIRHGTQDSEPGTWYLDSGSGIWDVNTARTAPATETATPVHDFRIPAGRF